MLRDGRLSLAELREAARACMLDGHNACLDPDVCEDPRNLMTPAEFVEWLGLYLAPPRSAALDGGLSDRGRGRIIEGQRRRRERERGRRGGTRLTTNRDHHDNGVGGRTDTPALPERSR